MITALLPMKGHSERVPDKNMRNFGGKPLYHAVLNSLLKSQYITQVIINTDSEIIKKDVINNFNKVRVIDRPENIRGDFVSMNNIIAYDISQIESEHFLQTHSTNPLLKTETINAAIETYFTKLTEGYDSVFSVTRIQSRLYWENGTAINHNPNELLRTQDLPPVFDENSNFYIFSRKSFVANNNKRIGIKPFMFEMNKLEAIDIDTEDDFILAELLYKHQLIK
jgi:CMP-N-acetylneuraminic acid synthetase